MNKCEATKKTGIIQIKKNRGNCNSKSSWMEKSWNREELAPSLQLEGERIKKDVEKHPDLVLVRSGSHLHIMVSITAEK